MGHTPLINAASKGYTNIVEYLLTEAHANPLIKNNFGEAAYDVSAAAGESYICDMLYKAGKSWWEMQHSSPYQLLDYHVTVMVILHENEKSSSMLGLLSKPHFSPNTVTKHGPWSIYPSGQSCTKDQVRLPQNDHGSTDWFWLIDWQIDYSNPRVDAASGWQYARSFDEPDEKWVPTMPTSGYGWVRRRKWIRVMKRRMDLLKGNHLGNIMNDDQDDYLCKAEDIVQNSKTESVSLNATSKVQQLTVELRSLEEAVQLLRSGMKNDGNQYRLQQANTLVTSYTLQIEKLNSQIAQLAPTVATPISPVIKQHNSELARELGFAENRHSSSGVGNTATTTATTVATAAAATITTTGNNTTDLDSNPWSRDTTIIVNWQDNLFESSSLSHVDLVGHGTEEEEPSREPEREQVKKYTWELDTDVKECRGCKRRFGLLLRRHHCRCCGTIHCDRCSTSRAYLQPSQILQDPRGPFESLEILSSQHQRVCDNCYAKLGGLPPS
ncbi:FYVE-domain-containing protein [Rhizopus microsporus var. microsporus]|uniref:FYVE-domain-containing protein n=1 Tax=Rhizopus microsporus var. microsporus TaxID=86635 RepID=A0A1X0R6H5_RHIZD|nr:FYVE-domain-containing protein [Rhizopus microsporus var. microsporus]